MWPHVGSLAHFSLFVILHIRENEHAVHSWQHVVVQHVVLFWCTFVLEVCLFDCLLQPGSGKIYSRPNNFQKPHWSKKVQKCRHWKREIFFLFLRHTRSHRTRKQVQCAADTFLDFCMDINQLQNTTLLLLIFTAYLTAYIIYYRWTIIVHL